MKNLSKTNSLSFIFILSLLFFVSCKKSYIEPSDTALDLALADNRFSVFTKLLNENGLVSSLKSNESLTIFAPTNDAFSKIDVSKLAKNDLVKLLNTHIVRNRRLPASEIKSGIVQSPQRIEIFLSKNSSGIFINAKSKVISPDISASNGVIHVIDNVIVSPTQSITEILRKDPNFSELLSWMSATGNDYEEIFALPLIFGPTILAPTNEAFEELYKITPKAILLADKRQVNDLIRFHIITGRILLSDFPDKTQPINTNLQPITSMQLYGAGAPVGGVSNLTIIDSFKGQYQIIFDVNNGVKVRGVKSGVANITSVDLLATNGVIHKIDKVLLP